MSDQFVDYVKVYIDEAGEYRWTAKAGNNEPVADSAEGYKHKEDCLNAVEEMFPSTRVLEDA